MEKPPDICVTPYDKTLQQPTTYDPESLSCIFRTSARLHEVVPKAIEAYRKKGLSRSFSAFCIGASFGSEIDSTAALLTREGIQGAKLVGTDTNERMIDLAHGTYTWPKEKAALFWLDRIAEIRKLRKLGFTAEPLTPFRNTLISSQNLRKQHDVSFYVHNEDMPLLTPQGTDLVLCNNTLPHINHYSPEFAHEAFETITASAEEGSIVSFAGEPDFYEEDSENWGSFARWYKNLVLPNLDAFNLNPIVHNKQGIPMAFQKL